MEPLGKVYRESGRIPLPGAGGLAAGTAVAAATGALVLESARGLVDLVVVQLLLAMGVAAGAGWLVAAAGRRVRVRHRGAVTLAGGVAGLGVAWLALSGMVWRLTGGEVLTLEPGLLWEVLRKLSELVAEAGDRNVWDPVFYRGMELLFLVGGAGWVARQVHGNLAFCEPCGVWAVTGERLVRAPAGMPALVAVALSEGDAVAFASLGPAAPGAPHRTELRIDTCPSCHARTWLTLTSLEGGGAGGLHPVLGLLEVPPGFATELRAASEAVDRGEGWGKAGSRAPGSSDQDRGEGAPGTPGHGAEGAPGSGAGVPDGKPGKRMEDSGTASADALVVIAEGNRLLALPSALAGMAWLGLLVWLVATGQADWDEADSGWAIFGIGLLTLIALGAVAAWVRVMLSPPPLVAAGPRGLSLRGPADSAFFHVPVEVDVPWGEVHAIHPFVTYVNGIRSSSAIVVVRVDGTEHRLSGALFPVWAETICGRLVEECGKATRG